MRNATVSAAAVVILLMAAILISKNGDGAKSQDASVSPDSSTAHRITPRGAVSSGSVRPPDHANHSGPEGGISGQERGIDSNVMEFPAVDEIVGNDALSVSEAVTRLHVLVKRSDLSLLEREEALAHGMNLDLARFADIVSDPGLPQALALRFFDGMLNENTNRELQVRSCLALMDHEDQSVAGEAATQLAFYIGLEEHADEWALLKQEAAKFLEERAKLPDPAPGPPDDEIPETLPIEVEGDSPVDGE